MLVLAQDQPVFINRLLVLFEEGGWIMWPISFVLILAALVSFERVLFWLSHRFKLRRRDRRACLEHIDAHRFEDAATVARDSPDPVLKVLATGLRERGGAFEAAVQSAAAEELKPAARGTAMLDTLITLGPLLGLLGTVTGIMDTFVSMGGDELVIDRVTGGIGEALIATAFGLAIAILAVVPFNWGNHRLARLQSNIELAVNRLEVALGRSHQEGQSSATPTPGGPSNSADAAPITAPASAEHQPRLNPDPV